MIIESGYNRVDVADYLKEWAYKRNPKYFNFDKQGGDCTNFASQSIYAGSSVMSFEPVYGWYYVDSYRRTASWSGVEYLYNFLINNKGEGPYGISTDIDAMVVGDIVQLGNAQNFHHSPIVCGFHNGEILLAAHSLDSYDRPLSSYSYEKLRFIHILGTRKKV